MSSNTKTASGVSKVAGHHTPWPLHRGEVEIEACDVLAAAGIQASDEAPICHFSAGVHVISSLKIIIPGQR